MKAVAITKELRRIARRNGGRLVPQAVVDESRPKTAPLHSQFEWDDSKAAEQHRLWQARQLIRVSVELIGNEQDGRMSRVFVSLTTDRGSKQGYRTMVSVLGDRELRDQLLQDSLEDMKRFRERYASLRELAKVFDAMQEAEERVGARGKRKPVEV